tara:strand:- start:1308 stop:1484 length:177 start_codon:yes stop_codon:yes gene_type:complete
MKVGDLVRVKSDPDCWGGFGIILETDKAQAKVYWVDEWGECPVDWNRKWILEVLSESR